MNCFSLDVSITSMTSVQPGEETESHNVAIEMRKIKQLNWTDAKKLCDSFHCGCLGDKIKGNGNNELSRTNTQREPVFKRAEFMCRISVGMGGYVFRR